MSMQDSAPAQAPKNPASPGAPACPKCGSSNLRHGKVPLYLGTIGRLLTQPAVCNECEHEFDYNKPQANWKKRCRNLWLAINGIGAIGVIAVVVYLAPMVWEAVAAAMK